MKDNDLIASVALFSELYSSETYKSIADILAEFIKGAVIYEQSFNLNSGETKDLLKRVYGFDIPESVVRTTLNNKLKDVVKKVNHIYHFVGLQGHPLNNIHRDIDSINERQNQILENLYRFIAQRCHVVMDDGDRREVLDNFIHFLMDNGYSDKYSNYISAFILVNEQDLDFKRTLNSIREGVILYQGISYTADLNLLGDWRHDLTIYLGTELLFSALGYNGILYQEIFEDFYKLVVEINQSHQQRDGKATRKRIELRYFEESKIEIDNLFAVAEKIKAGKRPLDHTRSAMVKIIKDSARVSDIPAQRVAFNRQLALMGIKEKDINLDLPRNQHFNVEDQNVIEDLKAIAKEKKRDFDEENCRVYFRLFTKVNALRQGINNVPFDRIGHIFMTETAFAKYLAHNNAVKFQPTDISFAKDIDFITTRFWFALKKGFKNKASLPKSFDVVNKAKVILSSHITSSLSSEYHNLREQLQQGLLSEEHAVALSYALREKPKLPEEIDGDNAEMSLDFLTNEEHLENIYRQQVKNEQLLRDTSDERDRLAEELRLIREAESESKRITALVTERSSYVTQKWSEYHTQNLNDVRYAIACFVPEVLGVLLVVVKNVEFFNKLLNGHDWYQWLYWGLVALLVAYCVYARSHIYNKERIKNGHRYLRLLWKFKSNQTLIKQEFENEFDQNNSPLIS